MAFYRLREVKKEIRVLGIVAGRVTPGSDLQVVGVVYRGRLYLDGVMRTRSAGPDITGEVAAMIESSPHMPQVRVILLDSAHLRDGATLDPIKLSEKLSKPVVFLGPGEFDDSPRVPTQQYGWETGGETVPVLSVGLKRGVATRILTVASAKTAVPEALRVAEILISSVF